MRRDVKLLYDVMVDTIRYIQVKMRAASSLGPTRGSPTARARRARRGYKLSSIVILLPEKTKKRTQQNLPTIN